MDQTTDKRMRTDLADAQHRHEWAQEQASEYQSARNAAVSQALEAGWTHAQIADATGLTRSRIGQIATSEAREWRDKQLNGRKT